MVTQAALMLAVATIVVLLSLVFIKNMVKRVVARRGRDDLAERVGEGGRLVVIAAASVMMFGMVANFGDETIRVPEMASAQIDNLADVVANSLPVSSANAAARRP